jgi:hypothetical protein
VQLGGAAAMQQTIEDLNTIRAFVANEMRNGLDFGVIPGTGSKDKDGKETGKPTLLQPGAQKIFMYFNCFAEHDVETHDLDGGHVEYIVKTRLVSRGSQAQIGAGLGSCSTMESKYRWRNAERTCPDCGQATVFKSKEKGKGFYCWKKKGGCGLEFAEGHPDIVGQKTGRAENPDIYDQRNTVLKMAKKRSQVDAAHGLGCMSELFTQDLDDFHDMAPVAPVASEPDRESGHREVNERFPSRGGREAPRKSPTPDGPDDPMPEKTPQAPTWAAYVAKVCAERRDYWNAELAMANVPQGDRVRVENLLPDQHQATNHMVTHAIGTGAIKPEDVSKDGTAEGVRDPAKAKAAMADLFRRAPKRIIAAVDAYFAEKERALRVRLGMDDLYDDAASQDVAEDVSQEVTVGREPGCDDDR